MHNRVPDNARDGRNPTDHARQAEYFEPVRRLDRRRPSEGFSHGVINDIHAMIVNLKNQVERGIPATERQRAWYASVVPVIGDITYDGVRENTPDEDYAREYWRVMRSIREIISQRFL